MDDSSESDFIDVEVSSDDEPKEPPAKIGRANHRIWFKERDFEKSPWWRRLMSLWSKCASNDTCNGFRVDCRCSIGSYRVSDCPAGLYYLRVRVLRSGAS